MITLTVAVGGLISYSIRRSRRAILATLVN
jgi:hypothetical protein